MLIPDVFCGFNTKCFYSELWTKYQHIYVMVRGTFCIASANCASLEAKKVSVSHLPKVTLISLSIAICTGATQCILFLEY